MFMFMLTLFKLYASILSTLTAKKPRSDSLDVNVTPDH